MKALRKTTLLLIRVIIDFFNLHLALIGFFRVTKL